LVEISHGLSIHSVPSGIPLRSNWSTSSSTVAWPSTVSRQWVRANWRTGGMVGSPALAL
jgi:hypothetical protein